jgi:hypothetical protein
MMWWVLAAALGTAAIVARPSEPIRVGGKPMRVGDDPSPQTGSRDEKILDYLGEKHGPWSCKRGDKQPIPNVGAIVPQQVIQAAGPIGVAIVTMINVVREIFEQIGASKVCTVRGGRYLPLAVFPRSPSRIITVWIEPFYGGAPAGEYTFSSAPNARTETGPVPETARLVEPSPRQKYLMNGGVPPGDLWPHDPGTPKWEASVTPAMDVPLVDVVRSGDELTLYAWLPPRAPRSHNTVWGVWKLDHPLTWRIKWMLV